MEDLDLIANLQRERDDLAAECLALANRLRQTPDVREIVSALRRASGYLQAGDGHVASGVIADLLRRLDESQ